jgi:hypothetical protein
LLHLAQGEAALMLIECLMSILIERQILSKDSLIEAVETVISTKRNMVLDREHAPIASIAAGLMSQLANSLAADK